MDRPATSTMRFQEEGGPPIMDDVPPPEYEAATAMPPLAPDQLPAGALAAPFSQETGLKNFSYYPTPPPYSVATAELPTYEESLESKILEDEERRQRQENATLFSRNDGDILGTDFLFFLSFLVSFLFNWVGFVLLLCFCHTLAGRYGALAGFGLSLAKWTLIVKHSTDLVTSENEWLWWIMMAFGILICARASLQYIQAKRELQMLPPLHRERLFFLY